MLTIPSIHVILCQAPAYNQALWPSCPFEQILIRKSANTEVMITFTTHNCSIRHSTLQGLGRHLKPEGLVCQSQSSIWGRSWPSTPSACQPRGSDALCQGLASSVRNSPSHAPG